MVKNIDFVNIRSILDKALRHPLLSDLNLELAVQYALEFIGIMGLNAMYEDRVDTIDIIDYRGIIPCNVISVNQVMDLHSKTMLVSMADNFPYNTHHKYGNPTFKTQGRIVTTSLKDTTIEMSYKTLLTDEDGFPLLPDNTIFLKALELYIKKEWFTILFDMGKIAPAVLNNTQQEYAFRVAQCNSEFTIPSVSEMEAITNSLNQLLPRVNEFSKGFRTLGSKEQFKAH